MFSKFLYLNIIFTFFYLYFCISFSLLFKDAILEEPILATTSENKMLISLHQVDDWARLHYLHRDLRSLGESRSQQRQWDDWRNILLLGFMLLRHKLTKMQTVCIFSLKKKASSIAVTYISRVIYSTTRLRSRSQSTQAAFQGGIISLLTELNGSAS